MCQVFIQEVEDKSNTPFGFKVSYGTRMKFVDYRQQYRFDLLQGDYETLFRRVFSELPDAEMELPSYMPQSWKQFWEDSEKAGRVMEQIGLSPQNMIDKAILFGKKTLIDVKKKTETVPEIKPIE